MHWSLSQIPKANMCSVCWFLFMSNCSLRSIFSLSHHICTLELLGQEVTIHLNLFYSLLYFGFFIEPLFTHETSLYHLEIVSKIMNKYLSLWNSSASLKVHTCYKGIQRWYNHLEFLYLSQDTFIPLYSVLVLSLYLRKQNTLRYRT